MSLSSPFYDTELAEACARELDTISRAVVALNALRRPRNDPDGGFVATPNRLPTIDHSIPGQDQFVPDLPVFIGVKPAPEDDRSSHARLERTAEDARLSGLIEATLIRLHARIGYLSLLGPGKTRLAIRTVATERDTRVIVSFNTLEMGEAVSPKTAGIRLATMLRHLEDLPDAEQTRIYQVEPHFEHEAYAFLSPDPLTTLRLYTAITHPDRVHTQAVLREIARAHEIWCRDIPGDLERETLEQIDAMPSDAGSLRA